MTNATQLKFKKQLFLAQREENERAKMFFKWSSIYEVTVLIFGILTFVTSAEQVTISIAATFLAVCSFLLRWASDTIKDKAQNIHRRFEFADGLGWAISQKEHFDTLHNLPPKIEDKVVNSKEKLDWFSSNEPKGSERLLENLAESACWTKHIAQTTLLTYIGITVGIAVLGIALLFAGLLQVIPDSSQPIARTVVSIFAFVFTGGYIRLCWEFWELYRDADKVDDKACDLLDEQQIDREEAIKLYTDYQLARAKAPLLPTWVYTLQKPRLEKHCRRTHRKP